MNNPANDKSFLPMGYTDAHYIAAEQMLEYKICFQNIGNDTAVNVRIDDQLDSAHLDLSSFQVLSSSHEYSVVIDSGGFVQFYFNHIMLPDSMNDAANSSGWINYSIYLVANVLPGDVIVNSAVIYFDDSEPLSTNDVILTIYDCSLMQPVEDSVSICIANPVILSVDTSFTYSFVWYENDQQVSVGPNLNYAFPEVGSHNLILERSNPICSRRDTVIVVSTPFPSNELEISGDTISAVDGQYWEWYYNDDLLPFSGQSIWAIEPGVYYAYIFSNDSCMTISEIHAVLGIGDIVGEGFYLYPNPAEEFVWINGACEGDSVEFFDVYGRIVSSTVITQNPIKIDLAEMRGGLYMGRVFRDKKQMGCSRLIVK